MTLAQPRGWTPGLIEHRYFDSVRSSVPTTYNKTSRTVDVVISMGKNDFTEAKF